MAKKTKLGTMAELIADERLSMACKPTDHNPAMDDSGGMDHWRTTIRRGRKSMTITFSQGKAHWGNEPVIGQVLDCLASDASLIENAATFEDFADELGYDRDSRKAEKSYRQCKRQTERLRAFMGSIAFHRLLYETDRF